MPFKESLMRPWLKYVQKRNERLGLDYKKAINSVGGYKLVITTDSHQFTAKDHDLYYKHSNPKLHVAINSYSEMPALVRSLGPFLKERDISHKFIDSPLGMRIINSDVSAGKFLTVYPKSPEHLVDLVPEIEKELKKTGVKTRKREAILPLTSRAIGKTGLVFYRHPMPEETGHRVYDTEKGELSHSPIEDSRAANLHNPIFGPDKVADIAAQKKIPIEELDGMHARNQEQISRILKENKKKFPSSKEVARLAQNQKTLKDVHKFNKRNEKMYGPKGSMRNRPKQHRRK